MSNYAPEHWTVADFDEAEANARLIAAAPLLEEALEEARDALFNGAPITVGLECLINNALRLAKTGRMFDQ